MSRRTSVPAIAPAPVGAALDELVAEPLGEVVEGRLTADQARALTERIRLTAGTVRDRLTRLAALVDQARTGEAWSVLGYASWTAYLADVLGGTLHLERDERRELVGMLTGEGLSTRAIAPIVGAGHATVARDVAELDLAGVSDETPAIAPIGLDGKRYTNTRRGRQHVGEHVITRSATPIEWGAGLEYLPETYAWDCSCGRQGSDEGWARSHADRVVIAGEPEQLVVEGTEPERMVPTLPGLGLAVQRHDGGPTTLEHSRRQPSAQVPASADRPSEPVLDEYVDLTGLRDEPWPATRGTAPEVSARLMFVGQAWDKRTVDEALEYVEHQTARQAVAYLRSYAHGYEAELPRAIAWGEVSGRVRAARFDRDLAHQGRESQTDRAVG